MSESKQIFQTTTKVRWRTFQWSTRIFTFAIILLVLIFIITLNRGLKPSLPLLTNVYTDVKALSNPSVPVAFNSQELKKL